MKHIADDERFQDWIKKADYSYNPFAILYAEKDEHLEANFVIHAGHFEEYAAPSSTIIVGERGSGKTANCRKLTEALRGAQDASNFVLVYDARAPWEAPGFSGTLGFKHHLREIICHGNRKLLDTRADSLSRQAERRLRDMYDWCHEYHPYADCRKRLDVLREIALEAGYDTFYLLIDERQSSKREALRTVELLAPLLDSSLFEFERLYVKLFVPDELAEEAKELQQEVDGRVEVVYLQWSESDLAELLRALLYEACKANIYSLRAEELGRLALSRVPDTERGFIDIDRAFVQAVAANAPIPRALMHLGQTLFAQCARRWKPDQGVFITPDDWTTALKEWYQFLTAEKLVDQAIVLVPFRILFTDCKATQVKAHTLEPSTIEHTLRLPYKKNEIWPILWALEQYVKGIFQLPQDAPHLNILRRLGLVQTDASQSVLANDLLERVGERLYQYLFEKSGLGRLLGEKETKARRLRDDGVEDVRLWLELRFDEDAAELACFPWELLRRDGVFLLLTEQFELTRYYCVEEREPALRLKRPFSLLYIAPRVGLSSLSYDYPHIQQVFRSSDFLKVQKVNPPRFDRLMQEAAGSGHQAFHYDDHGTFGRYCAECQQCFVPWYDGKTCPDGHPLPAPQGHLQFDDGHNGAEHHSATDVLHTLYDQGLQLALVNACKSSVSVQIVDTDSEERGLRQDRLTELRRILTDRFNASELRTLYFDLGVDYGDMSGEGKADKARELISYLERRNRIPELGKIGKQLRPDISWDNAFKVPSERLQSSMQAGGPSFGGVAPALVRARVPAVVGMLTSIEDRASGVFVKAFYETLVAALRGRNLSGQTAARALLRAMCAGRRQMLSEPKLPSGSRCWWAPCLSLRYDRGEQI